MRASRRIRRIAAALGALLVVGAVHGQSVPSTTARVASADVVAYARCESIATEWRGGKVFSVAQFKVLDAIKGAPAESITVRVLGGTAVHPQLNVPVTTEASHGTTVKAGEEAIVYVRRAAGRSGTPEHHLLSKDAVAVDHDGERHVINDSRVTRKDVAIPARAGAPPTVIVKHARPTVDEFVQMMKAKVRQQ